MDETRDEFVQANGECREIVVVPPSDQSFDDPQMHSRIAAALTNEFPQFAWRVTIDGPPRDNAFVLIPLLRESDAGGLLRAPPAQLLRDVGSFLNAYFIQPPGLH